MKMCKRLLGNSRRGFLLAALAGMLLAGGCATVPITGRRTFSIVPASQLAALSADQYREVLKKSKLSKDKKQKALVRRVGERLAAVVEEYERGIGLQPKYDWEFNVIKDDKQANAWAMPGGKTAIYTGILPLTRDETGLAVVMGHEIAHVVAGHGRERFSQGLVAQFGMSALSRALATQPQKTKQLLMSAVGLGSQVGILLPFSRLQESEADEMGLIFVAMAGYDPRQAIPFWQRMAKGGGPKPPELLSSHPTDKTRIESIQTEYLPQALKYYKRPAPKEPVAKRPAPTKKRRARPKK